MTVTGQCQTFLKKELKRTNRLRDAGPTGEPWPKKAKDKCSGTRHH